MLEYVAKFTELARFGDDYVAIDMAKLRKFEDGLKLSDRPETWCVKCTPMCASARVALSNIVYQWYGYRSTGTGVLNTKILLFR